MKMLNIVLTGIDSTQCGGKTDDAESDFSKRRDLDPNQERHFLSCS